MQGLAVPLSTVQVNVEPSSEEKNEIFAFASCPAWSAAWWRSCTNVFGGVQSSWLLAERRAGVLGEVAVPVAIGVRLDPSGDVEPEPRARRGE